MTVALSVHGITVNEQRLNDCGKRIEALHGGTVVSALLQADEVSADWVKITGVNGGLAAAR